MKPINRRYHDIEDDNVESSVTRDMSNGSEIVVNDLLTTGTATDGKEELTALAQQVCDNYEEAL